MGIEPMAVTNPWLWVICFNHCGTLKIKNFQHLNSSSLRENCFTSDFKVDAETFQTNLSKLINF